MNIALAIFSYFLPGILVEPPIPPPPQLSPTDQIVIQYFPHQELETARTIIACESAGNPRARKVDSIEASYGLFQINRDYWAHLGTPAQLLTAEHNVWAAHQIWQAHGWSPWSCAP